MRTPLEQIYHLRTQPVHIRERVVVMMTLAITGLIFLGWLGSANKKLSRINPANDPALVAAQEDVSSLASPVAALRDSFGLLFSGFNEKMEQMNTPE